MLRILRRFLRGTKGSTIVEFALVVPIFFMLVWGIIMFSRAYGRLNCLNSALREGARVASTLQPPDDVAAQTLVRARVQTFAGAFGCQINTAQVRVPGSPNAFNGLDVEVGVVNYPLFAGLNFIGGLQGIPVTRTATFRWEFAP